MNNCCGYVLLLPFSVFKSAVTNYVRLKINLTKCARTFIMFSLYHCQKSCNALYNQLLVIVNQQIKEHKLLTTFNHNLHEHSGQSMEFLPGLGVAV